jgi:hypothetical protein
MNSPPVTLQKALAAYGGEAFWRAARSVRATISTSGLAFVLKWQKPFRRIGVECGVREPITRLTPIDEAGNIGVLRQGDVFLENPSGSVIARRLIPYPAHRRVTPRKKDGPPAGGPVLIDLVIHDWSVSA